MLRKRRPPSNDPYLLMQIQVFEEHRFQTRITFYVMIIATLLSLSVSTIGSVLLLSGQTNQGVITASVGLISTTFCGQLAKDSIDRLKQLPEDLKMMRISSNE